MKIQSKADIGLMMVALFWGMSALLMKISLTELQEFNIIALRFVIAFFISGIIFYKQLINIDVKTIKNAFVLALLLFLCLTTTIFGINYTTVSNAGFLASLAVVFTPIISFVFLKQQPEGKVIFAVILAVFGIGLLTLNEKLQINNGDFFCILSAFFAAVHILMTGKLTKDVDSIGLGIVQIGFVGLFSTVFSLIFEATKLPSNAMVWYAILGLSIFATAFAFIIQTTAQNYTSPSHTGLIFSLEPVFCAIFAFIFMGEVLSLKSYIGAMILIVSIFIVELDFKVLLKWKDKKSLEA